MPWLTRLVDLPGRLPAMRDCLRVADQPYAEPGRAVRDALWMRVLGPVHGGQARGLDRYLPRLSQARASELKTRGIESISAIPLGFSAHAKAGHHSGRHCQQGDLTSRPILRTCFGAAGLPPATWISRR